MVKAVFCLCTLLNKIATTKLFITWGSEDLLWSKIPPYEEAIFNPTIYHTCTLIFSLKASNIYNSKTSIYHDFYLIFLCFRMKIIHYHNYIIATFIYHALYLIILCCSLQLITLQLKAIFSQCFLLFLHSLSLCISKPLLFFFTRLTYDL